MFNQQRFADNILERVVDEHVVVPAQKVHVDAYTNLSNTMVNVQTGDLRSNLGWRMRRNRSKTDITISSTMPYSKFVHDGTRAHTIVPKVRDDGKPGVLRFKIGGQTVFSRRVEHPGTKPRPFLLDALKKHFRSVR